ncbi:MAG: hypothetical protein ABJJ53_16960 [Sulfitobacter sp.]
MKRQKSMIFREIKRNFWADGAFPKKYRDTLEGPHSSARWGGDQRRLIQ